MTSHIDPITLEVVCEGLIAIVREMRATVIRASYSPVIWDMDDFSCALFDPHGPDGGAVGRPPGPRAADAVVRAVRDGGLRGRHPPRGRHPAQRLVPRRDPPQRRDHALSPVRGGRAAHLPRRPRALGRCRRQHARQLLRACPRTSTRKASASRRSRSWRRASSTRAAMALLLNNMRLPEDRWGDFNASLGACRVAEGRIRKLLARYGRKTVLDCIALNLDRSERRLREKIAALPDGEYVYEDYLEFYEEGRFDPVLMRLTLTVRRRRDRRGLRGLQSPGAGRGQLDARHDRRRRPGRHQVDARSPRARSTRARSVRSTCRRPRPRSSTSSSTRPPAPTARSASARCRSCWERSPR